MNRPLEDELLLLDSPPTAPEHIDPLHALPIERRLFDSHLPFASGFPDWFLEGRSRQ